MSALVHCVIVFSEHSFVLCCRLSGFNAGLFKSQPSFGSIAIIILVVECGWIQKTCALPILIYLHATRVFSNNY